MQTPISHTPITRRNFICTTALGAAAVSLGLAQTSRAAVKPGKTPVGLQLYSVRGDCQKDLPGVLKAVAGMGYAGVEFAGYYNNSAKDLKRMLDDNRLVCCGTHTAYESILPAKISETIEFNRTLGNKYLIVPWMTGKTKQDWLDKAKALNDAATAAAKAGMLVGYHAHAHDFDKIDGERAWDIFFGNTRKEVVMQLDTSNCTAGGADPVAVLKQYPGRAITLHCKAHGGGPEAVIGEDKVDWKAVFGFCEAEGKTEWYIVEHESSKTPMDAAKRSLEALRKMGKVS